jgi:hypothetical protein
VVLKVVELYACKVQKVGGVHDSLGIYVTDDLHVAGTKANVSASNTMTLALECKASILIKKSLINSSCGVPC